MISNIYLCSFSSPDLFISKLRFYIQSKSLNYYKKIKIYSVNDLSLKTKKTINEYLKKNDRHGYGYWKWKPEIILDFLLKIPNNSILHYCDIGSHFYPKKVSRLSYYEKICRKKDMVVFSYSEPKKKIKGLIYPSYTESHFTKANLIKFFKLKKNSKHLSSTQISATSFFIKKNLKNIKFIKTWIKVCRKNNLIDHTPSNILNHPKFIVHRNDQSIFSLLCKLNKIFKVSIYNDFEGAFKNGILYWDHLNKSPLLHKRDLLYLSFGRLKRVFSRYVMNKINNFLESYFSILKKIFYVIIFGRFDNFLSRVNGVVHVGANTGQERDHYKKFNIKRVVWVEADPEIFKKLKINIKNYYGHSAYNYLLTNKKNEIFQFNVSNNEGASSSIFEFGEHEEMYPEVKYTKKIKLLSSTLLDMVKKEAIDVKNLNALVLDTQGSELLILKGAGDLLNNFNFIKTEASDFKAYKKACLINEISEYLNLYGFKEVKRIQVHSSKSGGKIFDILFSKKL